MTTIAGELLEQIKAVETTSEKEVRRAERPLSDDRRWIAQLILYAFIFSILAVLVATFWLALAQPTSWKEPAQALLAIVAQVLLPVVTLVIGFYFRSEKR